MSEAMAQKALSSSAQNASRGPSRCVVCPTRTACLGQGLSDTQLTKLSEVLDPSKPLKQGAHLYRPGDSSAHHFIVRSGSFKTYTTSEDGDERVTGFYLPGEILSRTNDQQVRNDGAIALETSTACRLSGDDLSQLVGVDQLSRLMQMLSERETRLVEHQLTLANISATARVVAFLLSYRKRLSDLGRDSARLPMLMSRTDLASYLGMTLESLSRVTSKLVKVGLIRSSRREIELLDEATLSTMSAR